MGESATAVQPPQPAAAAAPAAAPKLTLFISYVHEDGVISDALNNALNDAFGSDVQVFMDKVSIQQGENIHTSIDANLKKADVLVVVSTGLQIPSYWAGYEIGFFQASHSGPPPAGASSLWGRIVVFAAPDSPPGPLLQHKYIPVGFSAAELDKAEDAFATGLVVAPNHPLVDWFGELWLATTGRKLTNHRAQQQIFEGIAAIFIKKLHGAFKLRPRHVWEPQKQLKIRFSSSAQMTPPGFFPLDSQIMLMQDAKSVFGVGGKTNSAVVKWADFLSYINGHPQANFWTATLARIVTAARADGRVEDVNGNLISSADQRQLFRVILTSCTTYYNDMMEATLYLVEVFRAREWGDPRTTLLAKGLNMAIRFRSLFLEKTSRFSTLNVPADKAKLVEMATEIAAELDLLHNMALDANLHQPAAWTNILTEAQVQQMSDAWGPVSVELLGACNACVRAADAQAVKEAKPALVSALTRVQTETGPINDMLLQAVAARLVELAKE